MKKAIGYKKCSYCGQEVEIFHKKRMEYKNIFCNKECESNYRKLLTELNCKCEICNKLFHKKPNQLRKSKHNYCSIECHAIAKTKYMIGKNNHQYGLKGKLNSSWESDERISYYGYKLVRVLEHPFKNVDDFVFEHRLVAEKYLLTKENSIEINGNLYLSPDYVVHHINFDRLNNDKNNLKIMTISEHTKLHMKINNNIDNLKLYCDENNLNYDLVLKNHKYNSEHYKYKKGA